MLTRTPIGHDAMVDTLKAAAESSRLRILLMLSRGDLTVSDLTEVLNQSHASMLLLSSIVAFFVAIIVIRFFIGFIKKYGFKPWGYYRIVVGLAMLFLLWRGIL